MPEKSLSLEQQLKKYDISETRFSIEFSQLEQLGYSPEQIKKLILRKHSNALVSFVIENTPTLLKKMEFLTHEMIVMIAAKDGGINNLQTFNDKYRKLLELEFTSPQILKIAARRGGYRNINILLEHYNKLREMQLEPHQMISILGHSSGFKIILTLIDVYDHMQANSDFKHSINMGIKEMISIISRDSGHLILTTALNFFDTLSAYGFSFQNTLNIASYSKTNLELLVSNMEKLYAKFDVPTLLEKVTSNEFKDWLDGVQDSSENSSSKTNQNDVIDNDDFQEILAILAEADDEPNVSELIEEKKDDKLLTNNLKRNRLEFDEILEELDNRKHTKPFGFFSNKNTNNTTENIHEKKKSRRAS